MTFYGMRCGSTRGVKFLQTVSQNTLPVIIYYTVLQQCIFLSSLEKSIATILPTSNPKSDSCTQGQNDTIKSP